MNVVALVDQVISRLRQRGMDYSAMGLTTYLAARMEQLVAPGFIRLMAATLRLVEGLVRV